MKIPQNRRKNDAEPEFLRKFIIFRRNGRGQALPNTALKSFVRSDQANLLELCSDWNAVQ